VRFFAEESREGGQTVHTPELFEGQLPATLEEGIALQQGIGDDVLRERIERAIAALPESLVYAGFSSGVESAQRLAQTRPGAKGALLYEV
jgi:hypothetical protein